MDKNFKFTLIKINKEFAIFFYKKQLSKLIIKFLNNKYNIFI